MAYLGKEFKLEKQENFEGFIKSLNSKISEDEVKGIVAHKPTAKLTKDGDTYTLTNTRPNENSVVSFKLGAEVDVVFNGRPTKSTFTMDGNTLTQVQKDPDTNVTMTFKREFSDNEMVATYTTSTWDGASRRYYKA